MDLGRSGNRDVLLMSERDVRVDAKSMCEGRLLRFLLGFEEILWDFCSFSKIRKQRNYTTIFPPSRYILLLHTSFKTSAE